MSSVNHMLYKLDRKAFMWAIEKSGEWGVLEAHLPDAPIERIGLILRDCCEDKLHVKLRPNWWRISKADADIWEEFEPHLREKAKRYKASEILSWLAEASHVVRLFHMGSLVVDNPETDLEKLYHQFLVSSRADDRSWIAVRSRMWRIIGEYWQELSTFRLYPSRAAATAFATAVLWFFYISAAYHETTKTHALGEKSELTSATSLGPVIMFPNTVSEYYSRVFRDISIPAPRQSRKLIRRPPQAVRKSVEFHFPETALVVRTKESSRTIVSPPDVPSEAQTVPSEVVFNMRMPTVSKPRSNRLIRSLAVLCTPFRVFGKRKDHGTEGDADSSAVFRTSY